MRRNELLTLKTVESLTGLSEHTLRAWEKRHEAVRPQRSANGRRVYTWAEVERLKALSHLVRSGHTIGTIARLSKENLEEIRNATHRLTGSSEHDPTAQTLPLQASIEELFGCLKRFELEQLNAHLARSRTVLGAREFALRIVSPILGQISRELSSGRIGISQEHALSAMIREHLAEIYQPFRFASGKSPALLFATPEGDLHEFGSLLAAIIASVSGFTTEFLGANLPATELARSAKRLGSRVIVLGTTKTELPADAPSLEEYLVALDRDLPAKTEVWVGGALARAFGRSIPRKIVALKTLDEFEARLRKL